MLVEFFQKAHEEQWDRVKVVRMQRTKPTMKFGLCFLRIHSVEDKESSPTSTPVSPPVNVDNKNSTKPPAEGLMDFIR